MNCLPAAGVCGVRKECGVMMKIVILDGYTSNPGDLNWDKLKELGDLTVYEYTKNQTEDVVERLQDCEIALTNKTVIK